MLLWCATGEGPHLSRRLDHFVYTDYGNAETNNDDTGVGSSESTRRAALAEASLTVMSRLSAVVQWRQYTLVRDPGSRAVLGRVRGLRQTLRTASGVRRCCAKMQGLSQTRALSVPRLPLQAAALPPLRRTRLWPTPSSRPWSRGAPTGCVRSRAGVAHPPRMHACTHAPDPQFALKGGDATQGALVTMYDGARPPGYQPMKKQGAISAWMSGVQAWRRDAHRWPLATCAVLGIGGDNSNTAVGTFFEVRRACLSVCLACAPLTHDRLL